MRKLEIFLNLVLVNILGPLTLQFVRSDTFTICREAKYKWTIFQDGDFLCKSSVGICRGLKFTDFLFLWH